MKLKIWRHENEKIYYRDNTSDWDTIREVLLEKCYRRANAKIDVEPGEHWLDLGANIGAFAVYCRLKGATCDCYEPEKGCFEILQKNAPDMKCVQAAVSDSHMSHQRFFVSVKEGKHSRGTLLGDGRRKLREVDKVNNIHISELKGPYDGVKMDIEGGEFRLIDNWLLPEADKLCFEYHSWRDASSSNLKRRLAILNRKYEQVVFRPELQRIVDEGKDRKPYLDRAIYCKGLKTK